MADVISVNISQMDWWRDTHNPGLDDVFEFFAARGINFNEMLVEHCSDGLHLIFDDPELAMLFKLTF